MNTERRDKPFMPLSRWRALLPPLYPLACEGRGVEKKEGASMRKPWCKMNSGDCWTCVLAKEGKDCLGRVVPEPRDEGFKRLLRKKGVQDAGRERQG
jgi:hypothetical protein